MWGFVADSAYNGEHHCPCEREIKLTPAEAKAERGAKRAAKKAEEAKKEAEKQNDTRA